MAKWSPKDPDDIRFYWVDFRPLGLADSETITDVTVVPPLDQEPAATYDELEVLEAEPDSALDDQWVVALFSGGWPGDHVLNYTVETSAGQRFNLEKTLKVKERKQ